MKVWLLNAREQLAYEGSETRLMRTGLMAKALVERGHKVTWWRSTFDSASKTHCPDRSGFEGVKPLLTVAWLHSRGYKRHVSLSRIFDHRELARQFAASATKIVAPDLLVCSYPVPELALAGVEYAVGREVPVVVDVRDWWPEAFAYTLPRFLWRPTVSMLWPYTKIASRVFRKATAITGITEAFVEWGLRRAGRSATVWDRAFPHTRERVDSSNSGGAGVSSRRYWDRLGVMTDKDDINIAFIGAVVRSYNFEPIVAAAKALGGSVPPVRFVICGNGDRLEALRRRTHGIQNLILTRSWVDSSHVQELLRRTALGLVPLRDRPDYLASINNKAVEYLSAGVPVVVSPEHSWVATLAKRDGFGVSWDGSNFHQLVELIRRLASDREKLGRLSKNAAVAFNRVFEAGKVNSDLVDYLEELASGACT